jgi:hypothetical protein
VLTATKYQTAGSKQTGKNAPEERVGCASEEKYGSTWF